MLEYQHCRINFRRSPAMIPAFLLAVLALAAFPAQTDAGDKALIVGVGTYSTGESLPGIDLDVKIARNIAKLLGIPDSGIKVLWNEDATVANFIKQAETWLRTGVSADDRVFVYFSGHGGWQPDQSGDEADQRDEFLCFYDTGLLDDDINVLLRTIPSRTVIYFADACHSGTSTRSFWSIPALSVKKTWAKYWDGRKMSLHRGFQAVETPKAEPNFIGLAAAGDNQRAQASEKGSVFTLAVFQALQGTRGRGADMTYLALRESSNEYISEWIKAARSQNIRVPIFNPVLTGDSTRYGNSVFKEARPPRVRLVWDFFKKLVKKVGGNLGVTANGSVFSIKRKDALKLTLSLPASGYLNILNIDANDVATVLFPNHVHSKNYVEAGSFTLPTSAMNFELQTVAPAGDTMVAVFLSKKNINFYEAGIRDKSHFAGLSPYSLDESSKFAVVETSPSRPSRTDWAGLIVVKVAD
ncbi:MAG: caspase family protein [Pseudomonadota bacterium]